MNTNPKSSLRGQALALHIASGAMAHVQIPSSTTYDPLSTTYGSLSMTYSLLSTTYDPLSTHTVTGAHFSHLTFQLGRLRKQVCESELRVEHVLKYKLEVPV